MSRPNGVADFNHARPSQCIHARRGARRDDGLRDRDASAQYQYQIQPSITYQPSQRSQPIAAVADLSVAAARRRRRSRRRSRPRRQQSPRRSRRRRRTTVAAVAAAQPRAAVAAGAAEPAGATSADAGAELRALRERGQVGAARRLDQRLQRRDRGNREESRGRLLLPRRRLRRQERSRPRHRRLHPGDRDRPDRSRLSQQPRRGLRGTRTT